MSKQKDVNELCLKEGHDWISTTADNYRLCQRSSCRAAQRLCRGIWVSATTRTRTTNKPAPSNLLLWDDATLFDEGLHPQQAQMEKALFAGWYDFLATERRVQR